MAPWPSSFFPATTSASTSTVGAVDLPLGSRVRAHPYPSRRPRTSRPKPNAKIVAYADALANYPNLVESSAATSPRPATTTKPNFPFGLDVILDGVDRFLGRTESSARHMPALRFLLTKPTLARPTSGATREEVIEPRLCRALGERPGSRTSPTVERRPDLLLDLAAIRQPVLRVPDRPAPTLNPEHVPADGL
jgi:hypothetical protein